MNTRKSRYTLNNFVEAIRLINKSTKYYTYAASTRIELDFVLSHLNEIAAMQRADSQSDGDALVTVLEAMKSRESRYNIAKELPHMIATGSYARTIASLVGGQHICNFIYKQDKYWQEHPAATRYTVDDFVAILAMMQNSYDDIGYDECRKMARNFLLLHIDEIPLMPRAEGQDMVGGIISIINVISSCELKIEVAMKLRQHITDGGELVRVAASLPKDDRYPFIKYQDEFWEELAAKNEATPEAVPASSPTAMANHSTLFSSHAAQQPEADTLQMRLSRSSSGSSE